MASPSESPRYQEPGWFTTHVFNGLVSGLTKLGISVLGSRTLAVRGRTSGEWRSTPVNLLTLESRHYLVAARGQTQWVRNLRAAGSGELRVGRRVQPFTAVELDDAAKVPVLRAYLTRWKWEVGVFFHGVSPSSSDEEFISAGPNHPVFEVSFSEGS